MAVAKRIVLLHVTGALAGLYQIQGTTDQLQAHLSATELPPFMEGVNFGDHQGNCSLIQVKPRYVIYRETIAPETSRFNEPTSFHPEQQ